jgi:hypothetical protein
MQDTCTEETLGEIDGRFENSPRKSSVKCAWQIGVSASLTHKVTKLSRLRPYNATGVHKILSKRIL